VPPLTWAAPDASLFLRAGFIAIAIALTILFLAGVAYASAASGEALDVTRRRVMRYATIAAAWLAGTWLLASTGALARGGRGEFAPLMPLVFAIFLLAGLVTFSGIGGLLARALPLAALVAFQSYRFPLELLMHRAASEGVMPLQMSYSGQNWDILTGLTAIAVAFAVARGWAGRATVLAWNVLGLVLLANIIAVALRSTPRFAAYGPDRLNTWVAYPPFVWLPAVMVLLALAGHGVIFRALASSSFSRGSRPPTDRLSSPRELPLQ
jgi:hypothetical protein